MRSKSGPQARHPEKLVRDIRRRLEVSEDASAAHLAWVGYILQITS
jgi:hypothetical protein